MQLLIREETPLSDRLVLVDALFLGSCGNIQKVKLLLRRAAQSRRHFKIN